MRWLQGGLALLVAAGLTGCATSRVENVWVEPTATPQSFQLKRVLAVALAQDGAIRRSAEDALDAALSSGPRGKSGALVVHPSYTLLDAREFADAEGARKKVEAAGYDGAVLLGFVSTQQRVTVDPPRYVGGFWGHYGYGGRAMVYDPGAVRTDTVLKMQVSIYSLVEGRLLWSGVSRTLNPREIDKLVVDVADAVRDDLAKRGLLP
jgi:hypothetical protein